MEFDNCSEEEFGEIKRQHCELSYISNSVMKIIYDYQLIGVLQFSLDPIEQDRLWIDNFEIFKQFRMQGFGEMAIKRFINELIEEFKTNGIKKISVYPLENVENFWIKLGFKNGTREGKELCLANWGKSING